MKSRTMILAVVLAVFAATTGAYAAKMVEEIEIEGMVTPASPKALQAALEGKLAVKVLGFNFYSTASGWPTVKV